MNRVYLYVQCENEIKSFHLNFNCNLSQVLAFQRKKENYEIIKTKENIEIFAAEVGHNSTNETKESIDNFYQKN